MRLYSISKGDKNKLMKAIYATDALKLLKEDYVLESKYENNRFVFVKENSKIAVYSQKYTVFVEFSDFLDLYSAFIFSLIETKEKEIIDIKKDEEYYSSIQKRQ